MSRGTWESRPGSPPHFAYGTITLYGRPFQAVRLWSGLVTPREVRGPLRRDPTTPAVQRPRAITYDRFGLFPFRSPLLRESPLPPFGGSASSNELVLLSFPGGTEMFHFPPFASPAYAFSRG